MTDQSGPFEGSAPWSEANWMDFAPSWVPSGVIGTPASAATSGDLAFSSSGLNVSSGTGRAWVRGAGFKRTGTPPTHAAAANAHASFSRRDRLVLRRDLANNQIVTAIVQGTPQATPAAPALTQVEAGVWEERLFSFLVPPNNGTTITGVIDERRWVDPGGQGLVQPSLTGYRSANQSIAGGAPGTGLIVLSAAAAGSVPGLTLDTSTGLIKVDDRAAGTLEISGSLGLIQSGAAGSAAPPARLYVAVQVNGAEVYRGQDVTTRSALVGDILGRIMPTCRIPVVSGDEVGFRYFFDSSSGATIAPGASITWMQLRRVA